MDKFKGHGFMLQCQKGYWLVAVLNVEPNRKIMILEPFRSGIEQNRMIMILESFRNGSNTNHGFRCIFLTDDEQDMIFNKNISPEFKFFNYWESLYEQIITIIFRTHFYNPSILLKSTNMPNFGWHNDPYEYKQIGQYFCRIPKTNKIYLDMKKDNDMYVEIWLLMMELHDIRAQIVWNMITLNRLDVDNYVNIY